MSVQELEEHVLRLRLICIAAAEDGSRDLDGFQRARAQIIADGRLKPFLPDFVIHSLSPDDVQSVLKTVASGSGSWSARRTHVAAKFAPVVAQLENLSASPADIEISGALSSYDGAGVSLAWRKAMDRRQTDPEGAITSARTLLEEVCKHILEDAEVPFKEGADLPALYKQSSGLLNLAPSQHSEEAFTTLLGSAQQVVTRLGELRNKVGDAHAQGRRPVKVKARHAALAVNLAGSMAMFLIETWQAKKAE